jgi:hypothetical protein
MSDEIFDLFGVLIDGSSPKRGRPEHKPTKESRNKIMLLIAIGRKPNEMAAALNITEPTLRKHYFSELKHRDEGRFRLEGQMLLRLYEQAEAGNVGAIKELNRKLEGAMIADDAFQRRALKNSAEREKKLGKKEQALRDAQNPDTSSPLGQLMAQRDGLAHKLN